jgi:carboxymethylenebutenolidase
VDHYPLIGTTVKLALLLIFGFMLVFSNQMDLVQAQSNISDSPGTTLKLLNNSTFNNTGIELQNKSISYIDNSNGYLVYPVPLNGNISNMPAVIMVHEWWGLNDNIKYMANLLARQGYVVLAADLFKGRVAIEASEAGKLVQSATTNQGETLANLQATLKYIGTLPFVDKSRIAVLGWCFGGGQALQLALNSGDQPLAATILYYGTPLVTDKMTLSKIKWPVLGIFGDRDQAISVDEVNKFEGALNDNKITNEIYIYPGVGHAFANPSGDNYAPEATKDAWENTLTFLKKYLG